jgi:hypothetical protein
MARTLKNSKINPVSNPDYVEDVDEVNSDASGAAEIRAERSAAALAASTNAGDFNAREAAKAALLKAQK